MRRREFMIGGGAVLAGGAVAASWTGTGCGLRCPLAIEIGTNHGHTMEVPAADVRAGIETVSDITGDGVHPRWVTLTAAHFQTLQAGGAVTCVSTVDGRHGDIVGSAHLHTVVITATCG